MLNVPKEYSMMVNVAANAAGILPNNLYLSHHTKYDGDIRLYDMYNYLSNRVLYHDLSNMSMDMDKFIDISVNPETDLDNEEYYDPMSLADSILELYFNPTFKGQLSQKTIEFVKGVFTITRAIRLIAGFSYSVIKYYVDKDAFIEKIRTIYGENAGTTGEYINFHPGNALGFRENQYSAIFNDFWCGINFNAINVLSVFYEGNADDIIKFFNGDRLILRLTNERITPIERPFTIPLNAIKDKIIADDEDYLWMYLIACKLLTSDDVFELFSIVNNFVLLHMLYGANKNGRGYNIKCVINLRALARVKNDTSPMAKYSITYGDQTIDSQFDFMTSGDIYFMHTEWCPNDIVLLRKYMKKPLTKIALTHPNIRQAIGNDPYVTITHRGGKNGGFVRRSFILPYDITYPELGEDILTCKRMPKQLRCFIKELHYKHLMKTIIANKKLALLCLLRLEGLPDLTKIIVDYI